MPGRIFYCPRHGRMELNTSSQWRYLQKLAAKCAHCSGVLSGGIKTKRSGES